MAGDNFVREMHPDWGLRGGAATRAEREGTAQRAKVHILKGDCHLLRPSFKFTSYILQVWKTLS